MYYLIDERLLNRKEPAGRSEVGVTLAWEYPDQQELIDEYHPYGSHDIQDLYDGVLPVMEESWQDNGTAGGISTLHLSPNPVHIRYRFRWHGCDGLSQYALGGWHQGHLKLGYMHDGRDKSVAEWNVSIAEKEWDQRGRTIPFTDSPAYWTPVGTMVPYTIKENAYQEHVQLLFARRKALLQSSYTIVWTSSIGGWEHLCVHVHLGKKR